MNMDPIDKMLQGEGTPPASPAQNIQQDDSSEIRPIEQQTEEEVEFSKLSGSAQDRFRTALRRARDAEERLTNLESQRPTYMPPPGPGLMPEQKQAIDTLSGFGISTDEKVDRKISEGINSVRWELKMQNLEGRYDGSNDVPKFSREEVEDYVRTHPQYDRYDPEDVFKMKMYPDEFLNLELAKRGTPAKTRAGSLKPTRATAAGQQGALTPEYIEERLKQSDGDDWYDANKDEINKVVYNHTMQFKGSNFSG